MAPGRLRGQVSGKRKQLKKRVAKESVLISIRNSFLEQLEKTGLKRQNLSFEA